MKIPAATLNIIRNQQLQKGKHVELSRTAKEFSLGFSFEKGQHTLLIYEATCDEANVGGATSVKWALSPLWGHSIYTIYYIQLMECSF